MQSTVRSSGLIMRALLLPLTTLKRPKKLIVDCGMLIVERSVHATFPSFVQFNKQLHEIPMNWIFVNGNCEWATAANGWLFSVPECPTISDAVMRHKMELCGKNQTGGATWRRQLAQKPQSPWYTLLPTSNNFLNIQLLSLTYFVLHTLQRRLGNHYQLHYFFNNF